MTRNATVTIRLSVAELDRLRAEAEQSNRTFSDLARERLGVPTGAGQPMPAMFAEALDALDERVRQLEQLANPDY